MIKDEKRIVELMKKHLRNFPLFDESHLVQIAEINAEKLWMGYKTKMTARQAEPRISI